MRFLVDAQLPPALTALLASHGHLAEHVIDIGPADAADVDLWNYALQHSAILVTKDEDFSQMTTWAAKSPTIVWIRVGNTRKKALLVWFEPLIDQIVDAVNAGNHIIELR
ncbi:MAG: DUF5615 family PIN-like protein [Acidipropionibacterium sp.]|nr:DUF5615 family PIN-like protein [Acidipropionibacterium sp.]